MGCCGIRVSGLAIANTLCFGATAAILTSTLVWVAVKSGSEFAAAAVTVFLFIWFCAGCTACLAFCRTLYRPPAEEPERRRNNNAVLSMIWRCIHGSDEAAPLPIFKVQKQGRGIVVLAREPPAFGGARVAPVDDFTLL